MFCHMGVDDNDDDDDDGGRGRYSKHQYDKKETTAASLQATTNCTLERKVFCISKNAKQKLAIISLF